MNATAQAPTVDSFALLRAISHTRDGGEAYVNRSTGEVIVCDGLDEEPEGLRDDTRFVAVPDTIGRELGKPLALKFAEGRMPARVEEVQAIFSARGAFEKFHQLLDGAGLTNAWQAYEEEARQRLVVDWLREEAPGIRLS